MTFEQNIQSWQTFLTAQGAHWDAGHLTHFETDTQSAALETYQKTPMLNHRLLIVEGAEAEKFLQGQTTCDIRPLKESAFTLGAHCNPQGRMLSSFWAFQISDEVFALRLPLDNLEQAQAALQKYIVFSKAKLHQSDWLGILFSLPPAAFAEQAAAPGAVTHLEDGVLLTHQDGSIEFWGTPEAAESIWTQAPEASPQPAQTADLWHIRNGIAEVREGTCAEFIPQQLNYDIVGGVNFKKGCYTGQEIVARLHYRGKTKKITQRIQLPIDLAYQRPGTPITAANDGKELATVLISASTGTAHEALVCTRPETAGQEVSAVQINDNAANFSWLPLPYAIPNE